MFYDDFLSGNSQVTQNPYSQLQAPQGYQYVNGKLVKNGEGNKVVSDQPLSSTSTANSAGDSAVSQPQSGSESTVNNNEGLQGATLSDNKSTPAQEQNLNTLRQTLSGDTPVVPSDKLISSDSWLAKASQLQNAAYTPMFNEVNSFRDANLNHVAVMVSN